MIVGPEHEDSNALRQQLQTIWEGAKPMVRKAARAGDKKRSHEKRHDHDLLTCTFRPNLVLIIYYLYSFFAQDVLNSLLLAEGEAWKFFLLLCEII